MFGNNNNTGNGNTGAHWSSKQAHNRTMWQGEYQNASNERESMWHLKNHQGGRQPVQREPEKKDKYPIFSDVQELQDELQSIYASGTAFTEQKTIDVTESECRMLPFKIFKIVGKGIAYASLVYCIAFGLFLLASIRQVQVGGFYPVSLFLAYASLFFYAYVVYGMKQFVIPDEKQPKTKQFYGQVIAGWRVVEFYLVFSVIILVLLESTFASWQGFLYEPLLAIKKMTKGFLAISPANFEAALFHTTGVAIIMLVTYALFARWAFKKFTKEQHRNVIAIKAQYDRADAAIKALDGEI